MKLYIAGPMRGYPELNFPAFRQATEALRKDGFEVVSPHEIDEAEGLVVEAGREDEILADFDLEAALRRDLQEVLAADGIVLLPGWWASQGARLEACVALTSGRAVFSWLPGTLRPRPWLDREADIARKTLWPSMRECCHGIHLGDPGEGAESWER